MNLINTAVAIANEAHMHQFDKGGKPYIFHALTVMDTVDLSGLDPSEHETALCVAVLHDVVEDGKPTEKWAHRIHAQLGDRISVHVELMTHRDGLAYRAYIKMIGRNEITRRVKLADLKHNMDLTRLARADYDKVISNSTLEKLRHYVWAYGYLKSLG